MKNITFIAVTVFLILLSTFFISGTVQSERGESREAREAYYETLEESYVSQVREYLNAQGYENSGVTLTRVVEGNGYREYEITLHHKYLNKLSPEECGKLFEKIQNMAFHGEKCSFRVKLLV